MRRQERKNTARLEKMTGYRLRIQQLTLIIRSTLHTEIIPKNQHTKADRRAGLFVRPASDRRGGWRVGLDRWGWLLVEKRSEPALR